MKQNVFIYFIFCFFSVLNSMDDPIVVVDPSPTTSKKNKKPIPALPLGITASHGQTSNRSPESTKKQIVKLSDLQRATSVKLTTHRSGAHSGTTTRQAIATKRNRVEQGVTSTGDSPSSPSSEILTASKTPIFVPQKPTKTPSVLPKAVQQTNYNAKILLQEEKWYSEDDLWDKLKTFNPVLHSFGEKHNMCIEELEDFALFLLENDIHPHVMAEHIHDKTKTPQNDNLWERCLKFLFGDPNEQRFNSYLQNFEKIKTDNKALLGYLRNAGIEITWEELELELMKTTADQAQADDLNQRSKITDVQTALLTYENENQIQQIRAQWAAIAATILTAFGGWAFGVVGQFINPSNCSH